jgi:hypothetical protein
MEDDTNPTDVSLEASLIEHLTPQNICRVAVPGNLVDSAASSLPCLGKMEETNNFQHGKPGTTIPECPKKSPLSKKCRVKQRYRPAPLKPGVKVAVPLSPLGPERKARSSRRNAFQMTTVVSRKRIFVTTGNKEASDSKIKETNCLSGTVKMDQFFLRNGEFSELAFRVMDDWAPRYMPRHLKVPVGSCVATSFGIGVLVGWRAEDDCHVVRSLWHCRGAGQHTRKSTSST